MGQKIHPTGLRLPLTRRWLSRWYATGGQFSVLLLEDIKVRAYVKERLAHGMVGRIVIERTTKSAKVTVFSGRPGVVIGKKGEDLDKLRLNVQKIMNVPVHISIEEIRKPELDAQLIAESIASQLEKRVMFRRAMKRAMQNAMRMGAQGIKIKSSGRLNGIEIARPEWYKEGRVPLHTFRADIDYGFAEANTTYGIIGVKVWLHKGDMTANASGSPSITLQDQPERRPARKDDERAGGAPHRGKDKSQPVGAQGATKRTREGG